MFKREIETDKFGNNQSHFYLTQGDSCTIYSTPYKNCEKLPVSEVEKCIFKLSNSDYVEEFRKEMQLEDDKFILRLTSEETGKFTIDTHLYEIEYTLVGGAINTPNQWKFDVLDQIIE